jgi:hypothetical protein
MPFCRVSYGVSRMRNAFAAAIVVVLAGLPVIAADKDTPAAAKTRSERLKVKVTVEWKNIFLRDCLSELVSAMDDAGLGKIEFKNSTGVSLNTRMTFSAKDKPIDEVLEGLLKTNDLAYEIISKKGDKADGGLMIKKK